MTYSQTAAAGENDPALPTPGSKVAVHECGAGPWGKIRYHYFFLEASAEVVAQFPMPATVTRWVFDAREQDAVPQLLTNAGLNTSFIERLLSPRRIVKDTRHLILFPSPEDLEAMSAKARTLLYTELARNPANEFHVSPIYFLTQSVREWAEGSGLSDRIISKLELLSYQRGGSLAFSDVPLLLSHAESDAEARLIVRKLTRVRTLMAHLHVDEDHDLSSLSEYWSTGLGLRRKEIEPLMKAISQTNGAAHLDLLHLLPPLPRKLVYTYPGLTHAAKGRLPDCHWTSLNFFNFEAQNYFLDSRLATSAILDNFERVDPPFRYGDILMFVSPEGLAIHSATYLADDIVYTKNGANMMSPWLLMRLSDLHTLYNVNEGFVRIEGFRHKK